MTIWWQLWDLRFLWQVEPPIQGYGSLLFQALASRARNFEKLLETSPKLSLTCHWTVC